MAEGRLHQELADNRESHYRNCTGFKTMVTHPTMTPAEIESARARCFAEDLRRLGPSIFRSIETWFLGYSLPHFARYARSAAAAVSLMNLLVTH